MLRPKMENGGWQKQNAWVPALVAIASAAGCSSMLGARGPESTRPYRPLVVAAERSVEDRWGVIPEVAEVLGWHLVSTDATRGRALAARSLSEDARHREVLRVELNESETIVAVESQRLEEGSWVGIDFVVFDSYQWTRERIFAQLLDPGSQSRTLASLDGGR